MKVNGKKVVAKILFVILLFIMCYDGLFNIGIINFFFKHIDEGITLLLLFYVICNYRSALKINKRIIVYWMIIVGIGCISNVFYGYQKIVPIFIDLVIVCPRFLIGYYFVSIYVKKHNINIGNVLQTVSKIITTVLFLLAVHDCIMRPFFEKSEYRYFMYSIKLMFPHVTYLAFSAIILLILLGYKNRKWKNIPYMLMASFLAVVTLRFKAVAFVGIYWAFYIWFIKWNKKRIVGITAVGAIFAVFLAWENIVLTFLDTSRFSPRSIMMKDSIDLMMSHFPIGTGFATFGTYMAQAYYSPLYRSLGYPDMYGMSPDYALFLSDSFWPSIIAQFGIIGTVFFVLIIVELLVRSLKCLKINKYAGFSMIMCLMYLLLTSTAESSFWNPLALLLMMLFGLFEGECNGIKKQN